jgi:hypothetical protein
MVSAAGELQLNPRMYEQVATHVLGFAVTARYIAKDPLGEPALRWLEYE